MKVFVVLCLASLAVASPQNYGGFSSGGFTGGYSGGYSAPTVVSERTYTIKPQLQGAEASFGGASYGSGASYGADASYGSGASFGGASYGGASYGGNYGRSLGYSASASATPVQVEQRSYQLQASAAPAASYQASGYYGGAEQLSSGVEQGGNYVVNFGVNSGRSLNLGGNYASAYSGYSGEQAAYGGAAENHIDLASHAQGETKIFKHVYAFSGPEEPATRARVVVKAPVSNSKHYKLVFIKAPTSGAVVDSDITLPAQEEEKTQIYVLSKQQHHQPTIRVHTAQAAKHNKPEVLFVKYRNEAEAQAIASGAINGQASGIPAGGQLVSDGSVSVGGASGNYGGYSGNSGYSGYSGNSGYSGASFGVTAGRSLIASNGASSGFGSGSSYGSGSGSGSSSFSFGTGSGFGSGSGYGSRSTYSGSF